jgi:hypothetical protein
MTVAGFKKIVREIFSEPGPNGTLSWGRIASSVALLAAIVWVSRILFLTHGLPALDGVTGFVLGPYGANKIGAAAQSFSQNPVTQSVVIAPSVIPAPTLPPPPMMIPPPGA